MLRPLIKASLDWQGLGFQGEAENKHYTQGPRPSAPICGLWWAALLLQPQFKDGCFREACSLLRSLYEVPANTKEKYPCLREINLESASLSLPCSFLLGPGILLETLVLLGPISGFLGYIRELPRFHLTLGWSRLACRGKCGLSGPQKILRRR